MSQPREGLRRAVRRLTRSLAVGVPLAAAPLAAALAQAPARAAVTIVVNEGNSVSQLSREMVERYFLKRTVLWPDGTAVVPVDQPERSPARQSFAAAVLRRSIDALRNYWLQMIFSGSSTPPTELASDAAVLAFVSTHPGSIGYVSDARQLPATVKVVDVER